MVARWWFGLPLTLRVFGSYAVLTPFLVGLPYAMFGRPVDPFSGLAGLGGAIGALVGARLRDPEYWELDKEARRRVREVQFTGQPSGNPQLDGIAIGRLSLSVKNEKANAVSRGVVVLLMLAIPIVAVVRTGHGWWLITSLPGVLCLAAWSGARRGDSPRVRLDRLLDQLG